MTTSVNYSNFSKLVEEAMHIERCLVEEKNKKAKKGQCDLGTSNEPHDEHKHFTLGIQKGNFKSHSHASSGFRMSYGGNF